LNIRGIIKVVSELRFTNLIVNLYKLSSTRKMSVGNRQGAYACNIEDMLVLMCKCMSYV